MALPAENYVDHEVENTSGQSDARPEELRLLEALLFASTEPLDLAALSKKLPDDVDVKQALLQLQADYSLRGVNLVQVGAKWTFRTANDLSWLMTRESTETRKLSRAAIEVLAIIAYHQPVTRAEIEEIRGVVTSKGTLDVLLETGWIRPRGRRKTPGRPLTFGTTDVFLAQFSLETLGDLPGLDELKGTGLLDPRLPSGFNIPAPSDDPALREDEDPLEPEDLQLTLAPLVDADDDDTAQTDGSVADTDQQQAAELHSGDVGELEAGEADAISDEDSSDDHDTAFDEQDADSSSEELDETAEDAESDTEAVDEEGEILLDDASSDEEDDAEDDDDEDDDYDDEEDDEDEDDGEDLAADPESGETSSLDDVIESETPDGNDHK